jgi:two-component system, OmpR family, sensor histidine kinase KdpD
VHKFECADDAGDSDGLPDRGALGSSWYGVCVETPRQGGDRIHPRDAEPLQQNVKLPKTLGATVVRVKAHKIAFAQREGVRHVIFGQSARTRWELLLRGSTLDRFLSAVSTLLCRSFR